MYNKKASQVFEKIRQAYMVTATESRRRVLGGKLVKSEPSTECLAQQTKILSTCVWIAG